jgi:drug/metabolite transporter (DMT)-like permease
VLSARLLHERMSRAQWVGVVMALVGLLFVIAKGDLHNLLAVRLSAGRPVDPGRRSVLDGLFGPAEALEAGPGAGRAPGGHHRRQRSLCCCLSPGGACVHHHAGLDSAQATGLVLLAAAVPGVLSYGAYAFLQRAWVLHARR